MSSHHIHGKVLIVSFRFPPHGGIGPRPVLGLTKHLSRYGWQPYVLTGTGGGYHPLDPDLLAEIPADVRVVRTRFIEAKRLVRLLSRLRLGKLYRSSTFPKAGLGWIPFAYRAGRPLMAEEKIDAIFSMSHPFSSHLVAYLLKRRSGKPWVAHYWDQYSIRQLMEFPTRLHKWIAEELDKMVVRYADVVINLTEGYTRAYATLAGAPDSTKFVTIPDAFDPEDFPHLGEPYQPTANPAFTISYIGSFAKGQTGDSFIQAMGELLQEGQIPIDRIKLVFVGNPGGISFGSSRFDHVVHKTGFVKHSEAISNMMASDVLLLVVTSQRGADNIPGKAFEYIASGKPILAVVPPGGYASDVITRTGTGVVADVDDIPAIKAATLELYRQWESDELTIDPDWEIINGYSRLEVVKRVATILDNLIVSSP